MNPHCPNVFCVAALFPSVTFSSVGILTVIFLHATDCRCFHGWHDRHRPLCRHGRRYGERCRCFQRQLRCLPRRWKQCHPKREGDDRTYPRVICPRPPPITHQQYCVCVLSFFRLFRQGCTVSHGESPKEKSKKTQNANTVFYL